MLNNNLKNQVEYFQTKFLESNLMNDSKDISSCLSDIYNSMTFDQTAILGSDNNAIETELLELELQNQSSVNSSSSELTEDSSNISPRLDQSGSLEGNSTVSNTGILGNSGLMSPDTLTNTVEQQQQQPKKSTWSTAVIPKTRSDSILQQSTKVHPSSNVHDSYLNRTISEQQNLIFSQIKKKPIPPLPPGALVDRRSKTSPFPASGGANTSSNNLQVPPLRHQSASATIAPRPSTPPVNSESQESQPTPTQVSSIAAHEEDLGDESRLDDPNLILVKNDSGNYIVRGGTLEKLVQRLSYEGSHDIDFSQAFLLTYRSFTTPTELLDMLIQSYNAPIDETKLKNRKRIIRLRVANVIKKWLDRYFHDFQNDSDLLNKLDQFISNQIMLDMESIAKNLKKLLSNERPVPVPTFTELAPPVLAPKKSTSLVPGDFVFRDLEPLEIARQMTLIESDLYRSIQSKECLNQSWNKADKEEKAPHIYQMIKRFNQVSTWVAIEILQQDKLKDRVSTIKRLLLVADKCRELGNYNGLMEIISGLQNSSVHRLKKTWEKVESKILLKNLYDDLLAKTSSKHSYKEYRQMLHTAHPPCVPYLGIYLTDLTFIEEGNKNTLNNRDDLINFEKRRKISVVIREIQQYQQTPYNLHTEEHTMKFLKNLPYLSEQSLYKLSLVCEPREIRNSIDTGASNNSTSTNSGGNNPNSLTSSSSPPIQPTTTNTLNPSIHGLRREPSMSSLK